MAPTPALKDHASLIAVLNNGIQRFSNGFFPLENLEENRLSKAVAVVREDPDTIIGNNHRKKARAILVKLLSISLEVFFLCGIGTTLDALSKLSWNLRQATTTDIYINTVSDWWHTVDKPEGLAQAIDHHKAQLPDRPDDLPTPQGLVLTMPLHDLLNFLKDTYGDGPVQIKCPFNECSPPSVEFGPAEWGMRVEFGLGIARDVMVHGMREPAEQS
jgi:hypothetical protein